MNTIAYEQTVPALNVSVNDNNASLLSVVRLNKDDITRIMVIQDAIKNKLRGTTPEIFLKKRCADDYAFMLDHGGAIFGVEHDGNLIGATCVNNAINKGRVEVKIDDTIDPNKIAVLQGTMTHPDVWGMPYRLADILYLKRMEWIADQKNTHAFTSVCSAALHVNSNSSDIQNPIGNHRVISGLKRKGMIEQATTSINDRADTREYHLNIMTLCYALPESKDALYTHLNNKIGQDIVQKWRNQPSPKFI